LHGNPKFELLLIENGSIAAFSGWRSNEVTRHSILGWKTWCTWWLEIVSSFAFLIFDIYIGKEW